MRVKRTIITLAAGVAVLAATVWGAGGRSSSSSLAGRGVVPPSSVRSGLTRSPNPLDTGSYSSNDIITGNVAGNKYFRGVIPYNSFSYFSGTTGTETVDSFLRYSGGPEFYGQYSGGVMPYYSPSRTVTYSSPGVGVVGPETTYQGYREEAAKLSASQQSRPVNPQASMFVKPSAASELSMAYQTGVRPMSMSLEEMEKLISSENPIASPGSQQLEQQRQAQQQQFEELLKQTSDKAAEMERKLEYKSNILRQQPTQEQGPSQGLPQVPPPANTQPAGEQANEATSTTSQLQQGIFPQRRVDIYEQMKQQLAMSQKGAELAPGLKSGQQVPQETKESNVLKDQGQKGVESSQAGEKPLENLSREELSNKAKSILGEYKSFASFSQDKFNRYMLAGEKYLKEGKFYLAADAYTVASAYKSDDPLAYAGKSHALFAAGEYMSSALYLSRTITIFPEYAQFKVDIIGMVGDKDKLESRIADVKEWLKRSDAAELHFLLAYVYLQMGRADEAKKSIDAAYEKMPDSPAVKTLKEASYATQK